MSAFLHFLGFTILECRVMESRVYNAQEQAIETVVCYAYRVILALLRLWVSFFFFFCVWVIWAFDDMLEHRDLYLFLSHYM